MFYLGMDVDFFIILYFCVKFGFVKVCKLMKMLKGYDEVLIIINKDGDILSILVKKMGYEQMLVDLDFLEVFKKFLSDLCM